MLNFFDVNSPALIIFLSGLGTFLLRLLPLLKRAKESSQKLPFIIYFTQSVGPAAVTSLLVAMLWPLIAVPQKGDSIISHSGIAVIVGLAATWLMHRVRPGMALPALVGAAAYGLMHYFLN